MNSTIINQEKSTHQCPVFEFDFLEVKKHPNADRLGIFNIPDSDYTYVLALDDWKDYKGKVCWIVPDSLVNTSLPQFQFLIAEGKYDANSNVDKTGGYARIKAKKLRGIVSYGLMVPIDGINVGDDATEILQVKHYEAPLKGSGGSVLTGGDVSAPPSGTYPKYDVDAFLKYGKKLFVTGEPVMVTEKIHGANSRYVYKDGIMYCGSRTEWKKEFSEPPKLTLEELKARIGDEAKAQEVYNRAVLNFKPKANLWWVALESAPQLRKYCETNPGYAVYGEVYGQVQNLKYGAKNGEIWFCAFDILQPNGRWMDAEQFLETCRTHDIPHVPVLHEALPFDFDTVVSLAEGNTLLNADHIREGVVVRPVQERWDNRLGRVNLKVINPKYLEL